MFPITLPLEKSFLLLSAAICTPLFFCRSDCFSCNTNSCQSNYKRFFLLCKARVWFPHPSVYGTVHFCILPVYGRPNPGRFVPLPPSPMRPRPEGGHGARPSFFPRKPLQKLAVSGRWHAGHLPHANTGKQHNFFRGLRGKKDGRAPCPPSGLGRMGEGGRGTKRPGLGLLCAGRMQEGIVPYTEVTIKAIYLWIKGLR